jgi:hypothetical protein
MKCRQIILEDGKFINIYDDMFDFSRMFQMLEIAKKSAYKIERSAPATVPVTQQFKTLKSEYSIYDLVWLEFFKGNCTAEIKKQIVDTELRISRAYINLSTAQDVYHYHIDSDVDEDITLLYYFNTVWDTSWEGETHFSDPYAKEIMHSVSFIPGRVVVFSASIPHKSSGPAFFSPEFRLVMTMKFHTRKHSGYHECFPIADLFPDGEIEISDFEQEAIDFLKSTTIGIRHSGTDFFDHCFNVYKILKLQKQPLHICLAGLFHSAYGTEFYGKFQIDDRDFLKSLIGDRAEELVFNFCSLPDRDKQLLDPTWSDPEPLVLAYANLLDEITRKQAFEEDVVAYKNKLEKIKR